MKLQTIVHSVPALFYIAVVSTLNLQPSSACAQGNLTPPGAPAPTMKTLQQIEPRTPISSLPFTISQPGSYYLAGNLVGGAGTGIVISNNNVTVDLMGFELAGGFGPGIYVAGSRTNICIRNGSVRGWLGWGVDASQAVNSILEDLRASKNGIFVTVGGVSAGAGNLVRACVTSDNTGPGILTSADSTVSGCSARNNGSYGVSMNQGCTINGCTVNHNGDVGILSDYGCTVSGCTAKLNTGTGIQVYSSGTITGCTAESNGGDGINTDASTVSGCTANGNGGDGIHVGSECSVRDNTCHINVGAGIHATAIRNRIDGNNVIHNARGLDVDVAGNLIIRNSARSNGQNYAQVVGGNTMGEVVDTSAAGGTLNETHGPWANFSF